MNAKICISIAPATIDAMLAMASEAEVLADVIEIRFDALSPAHRDDALNAIRSTKPLIATFRSTKQGGLSDLNFNDRRAFWSHDLSKFWAIDIEEDLLPLRIDHPNKIVSFHDFRGVPNDLDVIADRLFASDASIVKIAVTADDVDAIAVWTLFAKARSAGKQFIPIAMGEAGRWTRILGSAYGSPFTYASLAPGSETAGAQFTARDLIEIYRAGQIGPDTQVYGVIGDPVASSRSPQMHNAAFAHLAVNAVFVPLHVKDLHSFFTRMVNPSTREIELNFTGFAVTMPHKQTVMEFLDEVDDTARAVGAVNTIKMEGRRLVGLNTDVHGFLAPLKRRIPDLTGVRFAVLGAGGAASACIYALESEAADVAVFAREPTKMPGSRALSELRDLMSEIDVLINATPVGMSENEADLRISEDDLSGVRLVYDLVTRPDDTPLIAMAKKLDIPTIDGYEMLVEQGAKQFEIWTGREAPIDVMRSALK